LLAGGEVSGSAGLEWRGWFLTLVHLSMRPRQISAMIRLRNEEEFLLPAVESIADAVDEIVLVDNLSTDDTPRLIARLRQKYPRKVACFTYPYEVRRVGREHWELVSSGDFSSPHLSGNYYNWCLRRCRHRYVLKWDGDMIATEAFRDAIAQWRRQPVPILVMNGVNVHPDRAHLVAARSSDRAGMLKRFRLPGMPSWATSLTHDAPEPRLYPRWRAVYHNQSGWTQTLSSPFWNAPFRRELRGVGYLHMKFCKRDPLANYSPELAAAIADNVIAGPAMDRSLLDLLSRSGLRRSFGDSLWLGETPLAAPVAQSCQ